MLLTVGDVAEAVDGDVGVGQRDALGGKSVFDDLVLLGQQRRTPDPSRRQDPIAVPCGSAKHRFGMTGDIDRQRLLHWPSRNVGLRDLVVLALVAEEIPGEGAVEDVAELCGHLEIGLDVDAEPLEFVGLVAGADAEHQAPVRQRVGGGDLGREPCRVVERQDHDRGAEPDLLSNRGAVRDHHQRRRAEAIVREMMLGKPSDRITELIGKPSLLGDLAENLRGRLCRIARPHQVEDAEFHRPPLHSALALV